MIAAQAGQARPEDVRLAVDEILSGAEFQPGTNWIERAASAIKDWLIELFPDLAGSGNAFFEAARILVWVVLIAVVVLLAWVLVRSIQRLRPRVVAAGDAPEDPEVERARRVARLRRDARAAAARGEHVLALRLEFTALVVGLGERGDLEYRDAYTNRELLERGKPGPEAERVLRPIVPDLDRKSFGGETADAGDFARLAALCDRLLAGSRA